MCMKTCTSLMYTCCVNVYMYFILVSVSEQLTRINVKSTCSKLADN